MDRWVLYTRDAQTDSKEERDTGDCKKVATDLRHQKFLCLGNVKWLNLFRLLTKLQ